MKAPSPQLGLFDPIPRGVGTVPEPAIAPVASRREEKHAEARHGRPTFEARPGVLMHSGERWGDHYAGQENMTRETWEEGRMEKARQIMETGRCS